MTSSPKSSKDSRTHRPSQRELSPVAGSDNPRVPGNPFFMDNGLEMVEIRIDANNVIGPRPVTDRDRADHSAAYAHFRATTLAPAEQADPPVKPRRAYVRKSKPKPE